MARKIPPRPDGSNPNEEDKDEEAVPTNGTPDMDYGYYSPPPSPYRPPPSPRRQAPAAAPAPPQFRSRSNSMSSGGAVPRRRPQRRRLSSLNLDLPNTPEEASGNYFHHSYSEDVEDLRDFHHERFRYEAEEDEIVVEGQELYLHFLHEQMRSQGLNRHVEEDLQLYHRAELHQTNSSSLDDQQDGILSRRGSRSRHNSMNLENFHSPIWRQAGRDLQDLADEFATSSERDRVRVRAESVDVASLNMEKFFSLLKELFQGGNVTRERILVLFFFCSDIAIQAVRSRLDSFLMTLTRWSLRFIRERVCSWVTLNGGWNHVLRTSINTVQSVAVIGMCAAVMICCFVYVRKNI